jgi:hypothetical protein
MPHKVRPYYIRDTQAWAVEQERRRHNQALWMFGENAMFCLMWHLEDFREGLVNRCPVCYESQGLIADVYGQTNQYRCQSCFGTTFEGGFKALIVRPAIFADADEGETRHARGVVYPNDLSIESTPDFRIRTGDYCFRSTGDRYFMRVPERVTLRTGYGEPHQNTAAIGYNHANAAVEDPTSVAYIIPPATDEIAMILGKQVRIPRNWGSYEVIRAPLIPDEEGQPSIWSEPLVGDGVPGPPGPAGPPGTSGGSFTYEQMTASTVWLITHTLGYRPAGVVTVDSAGTQVEGIVSYPADNQVRIDFSVPFAGRAYLS